MEQRKLHCEMEILMSAWVTDFNFEFFFPLY